MTVDHRDGERTNVMTCCLRLRYRAMDGANVAYDTPSDRGAMDLDLPITESASLDR